MIKDRISLDKQVPTITDIVERSKELQEIAQKIRTEGASEAKLLDLASLSLELRREIVIFTDHQRIAIGLEASPSGIGSLTFNTTRVELVAEQIYSWAVAEGASNFIFTYNQINQAQVLKEFCSYRNKKNTADLSENFIASKENEKLTTILLGLVKRGVLNKLGDRSQRSYQLSKEAIHYFENKLNIPS